MLDVLIVGAGQGGLAVTFHLLRERVSNIMLIDLHNFTFGATPSMGLSGASISGMKFGVPRLVQGITRDLFRADAAIHQASLAAYDVRELADDPWAA